MKTLVLLSCLFLVTGCGFQYPLTATLNPQISLQQKTVFMDSTVSVEGQDMRSYPSVIVYKLKNEPEVKVLTIKAPLDIIISRLSDGLSSLGLFFEKDAPVRIIIELNQLQATVTKPGSLYNVNSVSNLTLKANSGTTTLIKKYNRQSDRKFLRQPPITEIESMLNEQLSDILADILSDNEILGLIGKK